MAAAGVAAAPAGAGSSARIYACYSDKTQALSYSPSHSCPTGSTLISWNKQGPQGAQGAHGIQGAQGAQGKQGARGPRGHRGAAGGVAGYAKYKSGTRLGSTSIVVDSVDPKSAANYEVNAMAVVFESPHPFSFSCWDQVASAHGVRSKTPITHTTGTTSTLPTDGILFAGPASPIKEVCKGTSTGARVESTALTAVELATASRATNALHPRPHNRLSIPRAVTGG